MNFSEESYPQFREGMSNLMAAFAWNKSPQGHEYWAGVHDNLRVLDEAYAKYMVEKES